MALDGSDLRKPHAQAMAGLQRVKRLLSAWGWGRRPWPSGATGGGAPSPWGGRGLAALSGDRAGNRRPDLPRPTTTPALFQRTGAFLRRLVAGCFAVNASG